MTLIVMQGGDRFVTPESAEKVVETFRKQRTCPALDAEGRTTHLVWNHVLYVSPKGSTDANNR